MKNAKVGDKITFAQGMRQLADGGIATDAIVMKTRNLSHQRIIRNIQLPQFFTITLPQDIKKFGVV